MPILRSEPAIHPEGLFASAPSPGRWWAAYVLSRHEKSLARYLRLQDIPHFLPLQRRSVLRRGRSFVSFLPLFPGYLFLRGDPRQRTVALESHLISQLLAVEDQGRLARELEVIWKLQRSGLSLRPHPYVRPGDTVEIGDGAFAGAAGTVLRTRGSARLVVSLTLLRRSVAVEFDRELVRPLARRERAGRVRTAC